jgi:8-oxo-dGTP diphosphatase
MKIIKNYPQKTFQHPVAAVDIVLFRIYKNDLQVLLLELQEDPFKGKWSLPGGLVLNREDLETSALRHLKNKIGLKEKIYLDQLYTFGDPDRDPLGWVISVAYFALTNNPHLNLEVDKRYKSLNWFSVKTIPNLAYDHNLIIKTAIDRLISKSRYSNILTHLMPKEFVMSELQGCYELLLNKQLDKRNFNKKILSLKIIKPLPKFRKGGKQRPARLYQFREHTLKNYSIL